MSHAQLNMIRIALFCIASIWFFCSTVAVAISQRSIDSDIARSVAASQIGSMRYPWDIFSQRFSHQRKFEHLGLY